MLKLIIQKHQTWIYGVVYWNVKLNIKEKVRIIWTLGEMSEKSQTIGVTFDSSDTSTSWTFPPNHVFVCSPQTFLPQLSRILDIYVLKFKEYMRWVLIKYMTNIHKNVSLNQPLDLITSRQPYPSLKIYINRYLIC